jgi:hypothetical protein
MSNPNFTTKNRGELKRHKTQTEKKLNKNTTHKVKNTNNMDSTNIRCEPRCSRVHDLFIFVSNYVQ